MSAGRVTGAELLRRALVHAGTRVMFGHPGGAILPFYDMLHGAPGPRHVLMRHEQSAVHAADGYARASGEVGVCVATSGPGAANLVTGLATSLMDGVPGGGDHRASAQHANGYGRLPGDRHARHHHAGDQAQLSSAARRRHRARGGRGVPHRAVRAARPGCRGRTQGRPVRRSRRARRARRSRGGAPPGAGRGEERVLLLVRRRQAHDHRSRDRGGGGAAARGGASGADRGPRCGVVADQRAGARSWPRPRTCRW